MREKPKRTTQERKISGLIVAKFLHDCPSSQWGKQRAMAYKLIEKFPEENFWISFPANEEVFSLAYYLTDLGLQSLEAHRLSMKYESKSFEPMVSKEEKKEELKPIESFEISGYKKKNAIDFMRGE
jgi:hypothetical protein